MSVKSFKFVSPGVFLNEIDNSILPRQPREIGPLFVGRAIRGPAMRPVTVDSFEQFVNLYGAPIPGGDGDDIWRNGNKLTPMYGTYAAQAWLRNTPSLNVIRLLGTENNSLPSTLRHALIAFAAAGSCPTSTCIKTAEQRTPSNSPSKGTDKSGNES